MFTLCVGVILVEEISAAATADLLDFVKAAKPNRAAWTHRSSFCDQQSIWNRTN